MERFVEEVAFFIRLTLVGHCDVDALIQVRQLAHSVCKRVVVVHKGLKDLGIRLEFDVGAAFLSGADFAHGVLLLATGVLLLVDFAAPVDFSTQHGREGVHAGHTDPVQAT